MKIVAIHWLSKFSHKVALLFATFTPIFSVTGHSMQLPQTCKSKMNRLVKVPFQDSPEETFGNVRNKSLIWNEEKKSHKMVLGERAESLVKHGAIKFWPKTIRQDTILCRGSIGSSPINPCLIGPESFDIVIRWKKLKILHKHETMLLGAKTPWRRIL